MSVARARLTPPTGGPLHAAPRSGSTTGGSRRSRRCRGSSDLMATGTGLRDVLIYVHGFNQSFETAALDAAQLSDGIKFRGETMVFAWPSKARAVRLRLRPRERDVVARRAGAGARRVHGEPDGGPHPRGLAQHRHHADDGGAAPDLRAARRRGGQADRRGGVRLARHRHRRVRLLGQADRPGGEEDHRHHRDQRPRAGGGRVDRRAASRGSAPPRRRSSRSSACR